jgi:hypothetical protein
MNKELLKQINMIARNLPTMAYTAMMYPSKITGEDVLLAGTKEIDGEEVDILKEYIIKTPLIRDVDHVKRLKEAYKRNRRAGVIAYLKPYVAPENFGKMQVYIMTKMK